MKKNLLLSLALLAVLASGARAASHRSEILELPALVVEAPPYTNAVRAVYASLQAMKAQAAVPAAVALELPALKTRLVQGTAPLVTVRLAKS
jgi:hypothetical protein